MKHGMLKNFSVFEIVVVALMAAIGLAIKPVIVPLTHMITGPLFIPGGAVAGGFYMMWLVLGAGLIQKRGVATMIALTQGVIVAITGSFGTHGIVSIFTYSIPGMMIDLIFFIIRRYIKEPIDFFIAGVIANMSGTFLSNLVFFRLPLIPLLLSLSAGILSGGLGGLIAYAVFKKINTLVGDYEED